MCQIIANVSYSCGHVEPWVQPRACQFDASGQLKSHAKNPLCLLGKHCWNFGRVRQINVSDEMLCSVCYADKLKSTIKDERAIKKVKYSAARFASLARKSIEEADRRSRLEDLSLSYIEKVTSIALKRLDVSFADAEMGLHHYGELLQIVIGLPFLDKDKLVGKFASKVEEKFKPAEMDYFYQLSMEYRNFGDAFLKGLKKPDVLLVKSAGPAPSWVPDKPGLALN